MDQSTFSNIFIGLAIVIGLALTIVYYFARYYFRTHDGDQEVIAALKKEPKKSAAPKDLREALEGSRRNFWGKIESTLDGRDLDSLEEILFTSDMGPTTAQRLFSRLSSAAGDATSDIGSIKQTLKEEMFNILGPSQKIQQDLIDEAAVTLPRPVVWLVVGVNGAGKTSTIGKMAHFATQKSMKVLIVAADTFRAAADEQLKVWAQRSGCEIFSDDNTKDPAAVAFAGLEKAKAQKFDLVIIDTAGRLHTQTPLMDELKKVKKVMKKVVPTAPNETLIVLDANSGQNALVQAKMFHEALQLTGVVLTKMDGTSKGGVLFGVSDEIQVPVRYIGVGEALEDLRPFNPRQFVESIL